MIIMYLVHATKPLQTINVTSINWIRGKSIFYFKMQHTNKINTNIYPPVTNIKREQADIDPLDAYWPPPPTQAQNSVNLPSSSSSSKLFEESFQNKVLSPIEQQELEVKNFIDKAKVKPVYNEEIPSNYEGLKYFMKNYSWQSIVKLSKVLLFDDESTSEQLLKSITNMRFEALFRMKLYDELIAEVQSILNNQEHLDSLLTVTTNDSNNNIDYHTTISMRLLLNNIKLMTGRSQEAMDQLIILKRWLLCCNDNNNDNNNKSSTIILFWLWEVKSHIINAHIRLRNWKAATLELNDMINEIEIFIQDAINIQEKANYIKALIYVMLKLAKLLLQIGSISKATICYEKASELYANDKIVSTDSNLLSQLLITQGLIFFTSDQFEQALDIFTTIIDTELSQVTSLNTNISSIISNDDVNDQVDINTFFDNINTTNEESNNNIDHNMINKEDIILIMKSKAIMTSLSIDNKSWISRDDNNILGIAINNFAICSLYLKRIREAIKHLEHLILTNPMKYLIDPVVFNLCTLYDLSFAPETSTNKKKVLQKIASVYQVDDPILHWKSFRLS